MVKFGENNEVIQEEDGRAILVGLQLNEDISYSMQELWGLAEAAGVTVLGELIQNKERADNATLIGKGKVEELAELCANMGADTVIFNDELSGMQLRNLEDRLNVRVIDRTILILDIFASRAISREGKLQVELAQLQYRLPRLLGFGNALSRLGGGIGTRGPGEKKLETDRRHIQRRMDDIRAELAEVKEHRSTQRQKRQKSGLPVVALVGYTNSGKSAIMNRMMSMTDKEEKAVFEKNMLFATLDTSQRLVKMDTNQEFILIDTVGFVSKLPHTLVRAFKATLEEVVYADYLLHVVDSSYEAADFHINVTESVLKELGAEGKEKLLVYNKIDLLEDRSHLFEGGKNSIAVSAKTGEGFDVLLEKIQGALFGDLQMVKLVIPYDRGDLSNYLCQKIKPQRMEYQADGTCFEILLDGADRNRFADYMKDWE
ncbi:MAG: GTPase HflX [Firmicutes bacterium]|nr:GTPase HflX [Bacillota bacterium]